MGLTVVLQESTHFTLVKQKALVLVEINVEGNGPLGTPALSALLNQLGHQAYLESTV